MEWRFLSAERQCDCHQLALLERAAYAKGMMNFHAPEKSLAKQRKAAKKLGIPRIRRHIFLCCDQNTAKCAGEKRMRAAWLYLKRRLKELDLAGRGASTEPKAAACEFAKEGRSPSSTLKEPGTVTATRRCWSVSFRSTLSLGG